MDNVKCNECGWCVVLIVKAWCDHRAVESILPPASRCDPVVCSVCCCRRA